LLARLAGEELERLLERKGIVLEEESMIKQQIIEELRILCMKWDIEHGMTEGQCCQ
jgi:hypothetical protein